MKKLLLILFSLFFLSSPSVFAEEDLSKINISNLKRLSSSEIIDAFSNTRSIGYYSRDIYGIDFEFEEFKDIYLYAHEKGLKGCTTFRFNPEVHQGVLVKEKDLKNTMYTFVLENGEEIEVPGDEDIEYDGETHSAANLFDALKEGYYGKF